jgi:putative transposase
VKRIAEVLGVSRSNLLSRRSGRTRPRGAYRKADDEGLLPLIRRFIDERPTYGYRRITALVNRELTRKGLPIVNRKRVHRIMQQSALLLEPHTGRREGRIHDGKVMVMRSNLRWCSDGLEFACLTTAHTLHPVLTAYDLNNGSGSQGSKSAVGLRGHCRAVA